MTTITENAPTENANTETAIAESGVETVTAIRVIGECFLKGNHRALRVRPGAILQVQYDRADRGYDLGFEAAVWLLNAGLAEVVEAGNSGGHHD